MLQVMIAQILPLFAPATLGFCVFSSFSVLLSSSGLLGLTVLEAAPAGVPALEPVCGSPLAAEQACRRPGGGCGSLVMVDTNQAGLWGGGHRAWAAGRVALGGDGSG